MNVWKFGRTLGQAFLSVPSDTGEEHLLMGILQNMVNPSLAPTQPEGSELPTFSYGGEGITRVLKQYRFFSVWLYFPNTVK